MRAGVAGRVVASRNPDYSEGDHVTGWLGVQEYATSDGNGLFPADTSVAPLPVHLGTLGMPGMTAYFGLLDVGQVKEGDTVVVSGAAGAVGGVAGQIAKIKGARAVGIAGGPEKCAYVTDELGFDACIDYKSEDLHQALKQHCPDGVDVYFDNVGGDTLDAVLTRLAHGARIAICGAISQYNSEGPMQGPSNYMSLLVNRATMQGFLVFDYLPRFGDAAREMAGWMAEGKLKSREDVVEGFEAFPDALQKLFKGENTGKLVLKIADE
jgi:NADPH-dependent curcumin reductase CurA